MLMSGRVLNELKFYWSDFLNRFYHDTAFLSGFWIHRHLNDGGNTLSSAAAEVPEGKSSAATRKKAKRLTLFVYRESFIVNRTAIHDTR
jgi:hypothetical protein